MTDKYDLLFEFDESLITSIGRLTLRFGVLEYIILLSITRLLKQSIDEIRVKYNKTTLGALIGGKHIAENKSKPSLYLITQGHSKQKEFEAIILEIDYLKNKRNDYIHGLFAIKKSEDEIKIYKDERAISFDQNSLWKLINDVDDVIVRLNSLSSNGQVSLDDCTAGYFSVHEIFYS